MARLPLGQRVLLWRLKELGAPGGFIRLVYMVLRLGVSYSQVLDHVEYFAGEAQVTQAWRRTGHSAASFEYLNDEAGAVFGNQFVFLRVCGFLQQGL